MPEPLHPESPDDLLGLAAQDELAERLIMHEYYDQAPTYTMKYLDQLTPGSINREVLAYTREYLQALKDFYSRTFKGMRWIQRP